MKLLRSISKAAVLIVWLLGSFALVLPARAQAVEKPILELTYATINDIELKLDVCIPEEILSKMPAVVYVHGGGFRGGDKSQGTGYFCPFLPDRGYVFISINYRLAQDALYPAGFDDVQYAIRWIRKNAAAYHIDPDRIAAIGSSAGATFASLLGVRDTRNPNRGMSGYSSKVNAVIAIAGVMDFNGSLGSFNPLQYYFNNNKNFIADASPVTHLTADDGPFLLIHGSQDSTVLPVQTSQFVGRLEMLGIPHRTIYFEGGHGISKIPMSLKTDIQNQIVNFLQTHTPGRIALPYGNY